jgi:hypothetical protein
VKITGIEGVYRYVLVLTLFSLITILARIALCKRRI